MKNTLNESRRAESCANCRYYCEFECRFESPITLDGKTSVFPPTTPEKWCGRWKKQGRASKGGRVPCFEWAFFRGVFSTLAPSEEKSHGYNVLFRIANDQAEISKSSFNIIVQKGQECGELLRNETTGKYWCPPQTI